MPPPTPFRLLELYKVQARIFSHTFNPTRSRLGTSVLRERLRGPSVASYYPRRTNGLKSLRINLQKAFPDMEFDLFDEDDEQKLEDVGLVKLRGKGAPKKKKSAAESKSIKGAKKKQAAVSAAKAAT